MDEFNERIKITKEEYGNQFVVTNSLNKGMKQFGEAGRSSVLKEMKQLLERKCFTALKV
jgi:ribosome biogenesis SPOUT family RNA methylase Rps3